MLEWVNSWQGLHELLITNSLYPKDSEWISEEFLDTTRRESTMTTATGALFGDVEISHSGLKTLVDLGRKEHWLIDVDHVELHATTILGAGGFGIVCEGTLCGATVAIKFPRKSTKNSTSQTPNTRDHVLIMNYLTELRLLRYVRHPNIVAFFGATVDVDNLEMILIFEKMEGSTLSKFIDESPAEVKRLHVLVDVAKALVYLHGLLPAVVHGDLKGENIFVDTTRERIVAKLGDFGLARRATSFARGMGGTVRWSAPEVLQGQLPPSTAADAYSFGQLAYFVVSGLIPLIELKRHEIASALAKGYVPNEKWPTNYFSNRIREISEACRKPDPSARLSMKEAWHQLGQVEDPAKPKGKIRSWLGGKNTRGEEMVHPFGIVPMPDLPPAPAGDDSDCLLNWSNSVGDCTL
ncbi:CTR1 [Symbiodinium natans]|uniref:CTR1 protein n=1 Tax=Symbiodinium natans TaxID=878477 RepID=A0A812R4M8_9DINO|nr:CTR1 [Symbiodinium natans]